MACARRNENGTPPMIAQARRARDRLAAMVLAMFLVPLVDRDRQKLLTDHGPAQLLGLAFQTLYLREFYWRAAYDRSGQT